MAARVKGLSHFGMYVRDMDKMVAFYRDFMGMDIAKSAPNGWAVFLCSDFEHEDHEIALMKGRPEGEDPKLIQQISFRVDSLDDVRDFWLRVKAAGYELDRVVSHASAIGCYFHDPEDNIVEVCCWTGYESWLVTAEDVDLNQSNEAIMAQVRAQWEKVKDVPRGGPLGKELARA